MRRYTIIWIPKNTVEYWLTYGVGAEMCTRSVIYRGAILHTFVLHLGGRARCPNFFLSLELQIVPQMTRMKVLTPFGNHNLPRVSSMTTNGSLDCWEDCRAARLKV
ncbi:hypothetical protein E4T42_08256 [Aureobasidium subglaciale]|nr:hypothetical protein E4T38_09162 [Aureobasidium subglaciale]KAI5214364.1 hypothetical protein E4T40_09050 [Aureobasidium subglaciale]KAI5216940.1 hypothetical protein E4T41_09052 [Aureobasidium subglaciale]KAI5240852.1 hypothetical protein E4T42_08256 [Aureobasidium subglaciale]KAI5253212.1 hypothetical protein E4T46_09670 [Aureobasidium subglaciale]